MGKRNTETVETAAGKVEVYRNEIERLCDDYIYSVLTDPEKIETVGGFRGMLKYVYLNFFKPKKAGRTTSLLDLENIEELDDVWNIYTGLCYRYGKNPTILNFSLLTGISNDTIGTWRDGKYRPGHSPTVKKWYAECEGSLFDKAAETGNPGAMFALKCCYGYTETPQQIIVSNGITAEKTAAEIAARHGSDTDIQPPLPPDL